MNVNRNRRFGMTLLELLIVVVIIVVLAALVIPLFGKTTHSSELDATFKTMMTIREAIMGTTDRPGYFQDMKGLPIPASTDPDVAAGAGLPLQMLDLFQNPRTLTTVSDFDPSTRRGWRGPYLGQASGSAAGFGIVRDSFTRQGQLGGLIVIQWPPVGTPNRLRYVRLVSFGPDGVQDPGYAHVWDPAQITANMINDDLIVYLHDAPSGLAPGAGPWTNYYDLKQKLGGQ